MNRKRKSRRRSRSSNQGGFNPKICAIPKVWCGRRNQKRNTNESRYTRKGKSYECLQQGIGAGIYQERKARLNTNSLQHIRYITPSYESELGRRNLRTLNQLVGFARRYPIQLDDILHAALRRRDGTLDLRAYNSVLLYLYNQGITNLPACIRLY